MCIYFSYKRSLIKMLKYIIRMFKKLEKRHHINYKVQLILYKINEVIKQQ